MVDVRIFGGGLPDFPGTVSTFEEASVPEASVSMSAALRGPKNFRVTTSLGGGVIYKEDDVLGCTPAFFEVPAAFVGGVPSLHVLIAQCLTD